MIVGIGVDALEIDRFVLWHLKSVKQLQKIYSEQEISYCLAQPSMSAARFCVRFAAREALFKALTQAGVIQIPFLSLCKAMSVGKDRSNVPYIILHSERFSTQDRKILEQCSILLTLTHSKKIALASVILQKRYHQPFI